MTIQEAYMKAKSRSEKKILVTCIDIGDSWAFEFKKSMLYQEPMLIGGVHYYTVNKITGGIGTLSSTYEHMLIIENGTPVNTKQFRKEERKELPAIEKVISKVLYPF